MREPDEITGFENFLDGRDVLRRCEFLEAHYGDLKQVVEDAKEELELAQGRLFDATNGASATHTVESAQDRVDDAEKALDAAKDELNAWDGGEHLATDVQDEATDEYQEMLALREAVDELGEPSCRDGDAPLISEDYFTDYAQELAEDCCDVPRDLKWPFTCIDWDEAADELKADYSTLTLFGNDYYYRNC